jgi:hypothetical protein
LRVFRHDIEQNITVDEYGAHLFATGHLPRIKAMIASVLIAMSPRPRNWAISREPRPSLLRLWARSVRISFPVAAKMALPTAGKIGGSVGSPNPVGAKFQSRLTTKFIERKSACGHEWRQRIGRIQP